MNIRYDHHMPLNDRNDFEQQWERRHHEAQAAHCPLSDDALAAAVDSAMRTPASSATQTHRPAMRMLWVRPVVAAAVLAAVVVPTTMLALRGGIGDGTVRSVNIGNQQVRFACNNGCSAEEVVSMFASHIHQP